MHKCSEISILIVDDEPASIFYLAEYLKEKYEVFTAESGVKALAVFEAHTIDILITDMVMPKMNGLELTTQVLKRYPNTVVIGISAYDHIDKIVTFMKRGGFDFIQKPIHFSNLDNSIQNACRRLKLKKDLDQKNNELDQKNNELLNKNIALKSEIEKNKKAQKSLEMSRNNLKSIFDAMNDMVFILDTTGCVLYVNPVVCEQMEYSQDEIIGMNILELHAPQNLNHVTDFVMDMLSGKKSFFIGHLMKKTGAQIDVETKIANGSWDDKDALIAVSRDMTDFRKAQDNMKIAQAESKAKSEFLANISHDLRTPLNGILGYTQILVKDKTLDQKYKEQIQVIHKSGEHLLLLINDILDLSKIDAGKMQLQVTDFYFNDFLQRIVDICQILARKKKVQLKFMASQDCPVCVKGDEKRLRQVLLNLINNAIKFTQKGQVTFDVSRVNNLIRFVIKDTGVGIPKDKLEYIFEPFHQLTNQPVQSEGTGLGLAISRRIIQLMDSDIFVSSQVNEGSSFWFDIHLPEVFTKKKRKRKSEKWADINGEGYRVLIVDDNIMNRKFFVQMLKRNKFELFEAEDGIQAIESTEQYRPHLILMDIMMPRMNGIEAIEEIRKHPKNSDIIIFTVSANAEMKNICKQRSNFCNEFILKPLDMGIFYTKLTEYFNFDTPEEKAQDNLSGDMSEKIIPPPSSDIKDLYQMAKTGNVLRVEKMACSLEKNNKDLHCFAQKIQEMAKGFQINELKAFLEQFLS
jgi:PAS domain S-box-containing protein